MKMVKVGCGEASIQTSRVWGYWPVKEARTKEGDAEDCVGEWTSYFLGTPFSLLSSCAVPHQVPCL